MHVRSMRVPLFRRLQLTDRLPASINLPICHHAVHAELPAHNLRGLWHNEMRPLTGLPDTLCVPHLWPYKEQREVVLSQLLAQ